MNKKSIKCAANTFSTAVDEILGFTGSVKLLSAKHESWCFDLAIILLYREFENLILNCLVALINNDSSTFSKCTGRQFPKHMNVEVCEYLICGDGYFDFKGYEHLKDQVKKLVPNDHWLLNTIRNYKEALERLSRLRNFAAHNSSTSKRHALKSISTTGNERKNLSTSGAWLKIQESGSPENRFTKICESLKKMAEEIGERAPY
ncbi:MAG: hypothetical protein F4Z75_09030 [Synechococcus sp. SB0668_bin_15]|nr:hypothetical protein [Synechococcus sp. SB0668_bin_15]MYC50625.1 hypothetical protein [Synechococcus sp. SB0662_bin_14]